MIAIKNFLDNKDLEQVVNIQESPEEFFDDGGVHDSKITSTQQWMSPNDILYQIINDKLKQVKQFAGHTIDGLQVLTAMKPYDVHTDYVVQKNQVPLSDPTVHQPTYTVIIPISEGYSTVVFNQSGNYNNFLEYKRKHPISKSCCSDEQWEKYCSHCHKEDQQYLTIKEVFEWTKGTLFAFDRSLFHCSSNFKNKKQAIVLWLSK